MRIQNDVRITIRVDKSLKEQAENLFERMGLNMTTALNVFLRKSVETSAIPFPVSTGSTGFGGGYTSDQVTEAFQNAVKNATEEQKRKGVPVARYDSVQKAAYLEAPDGTREYVNG